MKKSEKINEKVDFLYYFLKKAEKIDQILINFVKNGLFLKNK